MKARGWGWAIAAVVLAGAALRVAGMFDDFWLDEIWSWRIARGLGSAVWVLRDPRAWVDNNHPLNTLMLYWMGDWAYWPVYRVPAVVAGVGTVAVLAWQVWRRVGRVEGLLVAVLAGTSYPLVVYSSEARGYALMGLFAAAGFVAMERFVRDRSWWAAAAFWGAAALGFLSHLTFAHFYVAAVVWCVAGTRSVRDVLRCQLVPAGFAAWLYGAFARHLTIGGAPDTSVWDVVVRTLSVAGGGPAEGWGRAVAAAGAGVVIAGALVLVWRRDRRLFAFFVTCVLLSPAAFVGLEHLTMRGAETLFPRYFMVSMTFAYVLVAVAMGALWRGGWKGVVAGVAGCFVAGSLWQTGQFLRGTRGHYSEAVAYMAKGTPGAVRVGGDNAFRTEMLLDFYGPRVAAGKEITYVEVTRGAVPEWFVVNTLQAGREVPGEVRVNGARFRFEREFGYHGLSGWSWYLFQRVE